MAPAEFMQCASRHGIATIRGTVRSARENANSLDAWLKTPVVLSDTSPLIGLAAAGCFDVLRDLFGTVSITESVRREVTARKHLPGATEVSRGVSSRWIRHLPDPRGGVPLPTLGAGEATMLYAAVRLGPTSLVLLDDAAAPRRGARTGHHGNRNRWHPVCRSASKAHLASVRPRFEKLIAWGAACRRSHQGHPR